MLLLEEIFKSKKAQHSDEFNLRIHRGLSWLKQAVLLDHDLDLKFISLWISFNAIYAQNVEQGLDKQHLHPFLHLICQQDSDQKISDLLWMKFSQSIWALLDNQYMQQSYWDYQNKKISVDVYKTLREQEQKKTEKALQQKNAVEVLLALFNRLYTLRNQLMHGGSTYQSSLNRNQLQDACQILTALLPRFMYIALENADRLDLGQPFYPVAHVS